MRCLSREGLPDRVGRERGMETRFADMLRPNQLMEGDLVKVEGEFFTIKYVDEGEEGCNVGLINDFDELIETFFFDDEHIELHVYVE